MGLGEELWTVAGLHVIDPADPPGQLQVTRVQGDPLSMDGAQVSVREQHHEERLCGLRGCGKRTASVKQSK